MKKLSVLIILLFSISCVTADPRPYDLMFRSWDWEYSIYHGNKITPQTVGHTMQLKYGNQQGNFISTYINEKVSTQNMIDNEKNKKIDKSSAILYLKNNSCLKMIVTEENNAGRTILSLETSNFINGIYSAKKDTIRHFYKTRNDL